MLAAPWGGAGERELAAALTQGPSAQLAQEGTMLQLRDCQQNQCAGQQQQHHSQSVQHAPASTRYSVSAQRHIHCGKLSFGRHTQCIDTVVLQLLALITTRY
jgi:hypothetical protein